MAELCVLCEELGAGLVPEPLIPAAMAAGLLPTGHLAPVLSGDRIVIPAWQERANSYAVEGETELRGGALYGRKMFVPMAAGADAFLVTGRGRLALVARDAPGLTVNIERTQDGGNFGTLTMNAAPAEEVAGDAADALDHATLAAAAYLLGVMDRAFGITLDYLKTRQQFGRLIGSFQSLQHRAADLRIQVALARASVGAAAAALDNGRDADLAPRGRLARQGARVGGGHDRHPAMHPATRRDRLHRRVQYRAFPAQGDGAVQPLWIGGAASRTFRRSLPGAGR